MTLKLAYSIFLFLILPISLPALDSINYVLLNHAKNYTNPNVDVKDLCNYLVKETKTESDKAEIIFYWMSQNIDYDVEKFLTDPDDRKWYNVLEKKKGICQDYADLFKELCDTMNVECYVISGYAKGWGFDKEVGFTETDHAWNIVKVDGDYKLVDVTWGSGYVDPIGNQLVYKREIEIGEVLTTSKHFKSNHLPSIPRWQLEKCPISMSMFLDNRSHSSGISEENMFHFKDSISDYKNLDPFAKKMLDLKSSYKFFPTADVLYRIAVNYEIKAYRLGTGEYDRKKLIKSVTLYRNAIRYYGKYYSSLEDTKEEKEFALRKGIRYSHYRLVNEI